MNYKVTVDGREIEYGALVTASRFSEKEWSAIYHEIVKENQPELYAEHKANDLLIETMGQLICLEERYEALLELLPQEQFSYSGTHPKWVADAVNENTLDKETTLDDVSDMMERCEDFEELKKELVEYFDLEVGDY
ncbi:hypothetical protein ACERC8_01410 [Streptococcus sp. E29BA]|uniref:hypothetical protein n=1 Tax=Streptococcus sp. E29BA TaxID=3278716 RepID=UPI00359E9F24